MPRILAASAVVLGGAAIAAYFLLSGGSSKPSEGQFQGATAPVSFTYPSELVARQPPRGGLLKPTFSTAVGLNAANYVVVATYRISADVQSDGSAIGTAAAASPPIASTSPSIAPPSASPPPRSSRRRARSSPARPAT